MLQEEVLRGYESTRDEMAKKLLEFIAADPGPRSKIRVWLKFKGSNVAHEEWLTHKQYSFLKTLACVQVCKTSDLQ
jgi:hypothetical protein